MPDLTGFDESFFAASAGAWRDGLRRRDFSPVELLEAVWARILERNPPLNALVAWDEAGARRAAEDSERRYGRGEARPLEGLPLSVKDSFAVQGMPTTCGAAELADYRPAEDALAVARLRAAGAVILAKSNVPRLTGDYQTYNSLFGVTANPYDLARSPGGSSGGSAASAAAGFCAFEFGSDLGGSIRWPAHGCGLFGLKTSWGLIPMLGHIPPLPTIKLKSPPDLGVAGPLARSAADLGLALSVAAGPVNARGPAFLPKPRKTRPQDWRIALWLEPGFAPVDAEVEQGVLRAAEAFREAGARVEPAKPAFAFAEAFEIYALLNFAIGFAGRPRLFARSFPRARAILLRAICPMRRCGRERREWTRVCSPGLPSAAPRSSATSPRFSRTGTPFSARRRPVWRWSTIMAAICSPGACRFAAAICPITT